MKIAGTVLSEFNLGLTPKELFYKCEWWEILGLLYYIYEKNIMEKIAIEDHRKKEEIKNKVNNGKMKMYYKKNITNKLKEELIGSE